MHRRRRIRSVLENTRTDSPDFHPPDQFTRPLSLPDIAYTLG